jgi:hypothetical protein
MGYAGTVQEIYAAFGRGDVGTILGHLAPDVRWEDGAPDHGIPWLRPGVGHEAALAFFGIVAQWRFERFEVQAITEANNIVIGLLSAKAHTEHGSFDNLEVHVWRFNEQGKVQSFNHVADTLQHLRAAGLA